MKDLLTIIQAAAEGLTSGELFENPATDTPIEVRYHSLQIPPKRKTPEQGEDVPFCEIIPIRRTVKPSPGFIVHMDFVLHVTDDDQAIDDLSRLQNCIDPMASMIMAPYKLIEMDSHWGVQEGVHARPYYRLVYSLRFVSLPVRKGCRLAPATV